MTPNYADLIQIVANGQTVGPRGLGTREVIGASVVFTPGETVKRRRYNSRLAWVELLQLLAGTFDQRALQRVAPNAEQGLFTAQMAYGPRTYRQIPGVLDALREDPATRRAVLFVGDPFTGPTAALPCTETIQFLVRDGRLYTVVNMRSWDVVRGLPYDIVMFGGLAQAVASVLGYNLGFAKVNAGSLHLYDSDDWITLESNALWHGSRFELPKFDSWQAVRYWASEELRAAPWNDNIRGLQPLGLVTDA